MGTISSESIESVLHDPVIRGREITKNPTISDFDEEVNIYLVNLVCNFSSSSYLDKSSKYVLNLPINLVVQKAYDQNDKRERYNYFILNAEYVLFMLGVMFNVDRQMHVSRYRKELFSEEDERKAMCYRGGLLYSMAASTLRNLRGKNAFARTLEKISDDGVENYVQIVRAGFDYVANSDNKNVAIIGLPKHSDEPIKKSIEDIMGTLSKKEIEILKDEILSIYSKYLDNPSIELYKRMADTEKVIRRQDSAYLFFPLHRK